MDLSALRSVVSNRVADFVLAPSIRFTKLHFASPVSGSSSWFRRHNSQVAMISGRFLVSGPKGCSHCHGTIRLASAI